MKTYWLKWSVPESEAASLPSGKRIDWQRGLFWLSPLELIGLHTLAAICGALVSALWSALV